MNGMVRRVDDFIRQGAHALHGRTFGANRVKQALASIGGMRASRFAETSGENLIRSLKEQNRDRQAFATQHAQLFCKVREKFPFTKTDHERRSLDVTSLVFGRMNQARERRQQREWHVVNAKEPEILKCICG